MKKGEKFADSFYLWGTPIFMSLLYTFLIYGNVVPPEINFNKFSGFYLGCFVWFICGLVLDIRIKRKGLTIREIVKKILDNH